MAITYIVVSEKNAWGTGDSVRKALENAGLREHTRTNFFAENLEYEFDVRKVWSEWVEYGRDEMKALDDDMVRFTLYRFDDEVWSEWEVSSIDGAVTFNHDPAVTGWTPEIAREHFGTCWLNGLWVNGKISHR